MEKPDRFAPNKLIKKMKKAGTIPTTFRNELRPPLWLALAQLMFAAVLLYAIRNPITLEQVSSYVFQNKQPEPAIIINIPLSTVAVAAPVKQKPSEIPM